MLNLSATIAIGVFLLTLRRPVWGAAGLILLWPAYLLRTEIVRIPTTALELSIYAAVTAVGILLITRRIPWHWVHMSRPTWCLLSLWVFAWALATMMAADRTAALGAMKAWLIDPLAFLGLLAIVITTEADRRFVLGAAALSAAHVALAGLVQLIGFRETLQEGRLSSYFAPVANYAAMFLAPLTVMQVGLLLHGAWRGKVWWIVFGVSLLGTLATISFAGYLSLVAGGALLWVFLPSGRKKKNILLGAIISGILALIMLTQSPNFQQHFDFSGRSSGSVREQIWVTSWALVKQHPIFGLGPNNFESAYRAELPHHYFPPLEWLVAQPHNLALALWLETGLLGFATFTTLFIYHLFVVWKNILPQPTERVIAIASLAGLTAIVAHGLFDTPYFKNDLALIFLFIATLPWLGRVSKKS